MRNLSTFILFFGLIAPMFGQSPHGDSLKLNCAACHNQDGWEIPMSEWNFEENKKPKISETTGWIIPEDTTKFNHFNTNFPLDGQHAKTDCRACHETLVFEEASMQCIDCHTDMHEMTAGSDCRRCHTTETWLVDDITELHFNEGFPLQGVHAAITCAECHASETNLQFGRNGNDCASCHLEDFMATTNPDHNAAGFSTNCIDCHNIDDPNWETETVDHSFFPLEKGHEIADCAACHIGGDFANTPTDCIGCHQIDFEKSESPNHQAANFSTDCASCHTTDLGWEPAEYRDHDGEFFPIYSGSHEGTWATCVECHQNENDYSEFTCTTCHTNPETDDQHVSVNGYSYESGACLACHPTGESDDVFDHNRTDFPLTGAHVTTDCIECHAQGFAGTPTDCEACHQLDFDQTTNPNHQSLGLSNDCKTCHTTEPGWMPARFDIHDDFYQLNGAHAAIANECASCHNDDYNNTPTSCDGCHLADFNETTDPDHEAAQFPLDCASCHSESAWVPSTFNHDDFYPLTGEHKVIENECAACHIAGNFSNTPNTCDGCHQADFDGSLNPNHNELNLSTDCASCHTTVADWMPASFDIHDDFYPLNGAHALIANDCASCHNGDYLNTPNDCIGCHQTDFDNTTEPNHQALNFSTNCTECHSESAWVPATFDHDVQHFPIYSGAHEGEWTSCNECHQNPSNYMEFTCIGCHQNPETDNQHPGVTGYVYEDNACLACHPTGDADDVFDHNQTNFPLTGAHIITDCIECHAAGYAGTPTECEACHQLDFNQTTNPNHQSLGLSNDCKTCHTTDPGWSPARFDNHDDFYELKGAHAAVANECASCHNGDYNNTPTSCDGCHLADFNQTTDPDHEAAQFPLDCASCHSESAWVPATFNHDDIYPLTGEHKVIENECAKCHINGNYSNTPNTCEGCHQQDFNTSLNPNHVQLNLPTDCKMCHTTAADWQPASFDIHDDFWQLNGAHATIANQCASCHNGDYNNTPTDCIGCHQTDFNQTTNPNHVQAQFSTDCATCHNETAWVPADFDHDLQHFPIYSGEHAGEWDACIDCHINLDNYAEFTCVTCHENPETNDDHAGVNGYVYESTACLACHPTGDADNIFDHNMTAFPLTGAHVVTECIACHATGYENTPTDCESCHIADFNQSTNPNHVALGISTDCKTCHTTEPGWAPAQFANHDDFYVLNGAHATIANDCASCHNGDYNNTPNTCDGCHIDDYNQTTAPNHLAAQFPKDCASCHTESTWVPSTFNHDDFYPLTGEHKVIENECAKCHINGNYSNTPNTCDGCHQQDFNTSINPNHVQLNLSADCASCHTTAPDWQPAAFPNHDDFWQLNGAHATIANQCASCHNGDYNNTPTDCFGCHQTDYNQTTNPNHAAAQFSTDCASCHTETAWVPSTFDHDGEHFPIYSGEHAGEWDACVDCHTNPNDYSEFTCITCHMNPETDNDHVGINGYSYNSSSCLACHPTGSANDNFDHNLTNFPLTGAHITTDCIECHAQGYAGTPTNCDACHLTDFNQTTNPNHQTLGLSTDCQTCHTTDPGWTPATFADHNNYWVLDGGHIPIANQCVDCHNGDYNNTPTTCEGCHQTDYNTSLNPNHQALSLATDCASCHTTAAGWAPASFAIHDDYWVIDGAHLPIANQCADCHNGDYNNTPSDCNGCHNSDFNQTTNPNHQNLGLSTDCASCHTTTPGWMPAQFPDHDNYWQLNGAHAAIANQCVDCHNGDYNNTPTDCFSCHQNDYNQTTNPDHQATQIPTDCALCHNESAWVPTTFDHSQFYPLTGAHAAIMNDCALCHVGGNYTNTPNTCDGCHLTDYNQSTNPNHQTLGLSTDCESCHTTDPGWAPAQFPDHDNYWVLDGGHLAVANQCVDCHNGNYNNTPTNCDGCHMPDYNNSTNPNHQALGLSTDCVTCHTTAPGWTPAQFPNHDNYWVIDGAHLPIANQCTECHVGGNYSTTPNTCDGCHMPDYNGSTTPNHSAIGIPTTCDDCHTTDPGWAPATFDIHDNYWVLDGAHLPIASQCVDCHNGDYNNTPSDCNGCHQTDYNSTTNPNHGAIGIGTDCESCHTTDPGWMPATFPIHDNYWVLNGAHLAIQNQCVDCHNGDYNNTPTTCDGCHIADYNSTTNPDHVTAGFPLDCAICHDETAWIPSTFDHNATNFPLTGEHIGVDCIECHAAGYVGTPTNCDACHMPDFNSTTNPDHGAIGIPVTCDDCHTTDPNWMPATFAIHDNYWPLNGEHANIANQCATCHNGDYNNTPSDCYGCHASDYNNATNPNHAAAGFPTTCESCHNETAWDPSTFDHDNLYFPIYSGKHDDEWTTCDECHTTPGDFTMFSCIDCHEHNNQNYVNGQHNGVSGYQYLSSACYACHPDGED